MLQFDLETLLMSELDGVDLSEVGIIWIDIEGMVSRHAGVLIEAGGSPIDTEPRLTLDPLVVDTGMDVLGATATAYPFGEMLSTAISNDRVASETVGLLGVETTVEMPEA